MGIFGCPCGCDDCSRPSEEVAGAVRSWLDRRKFHPSGPPSPETIREFETCIDDMEAKHG